jgi:hypothetical protein
MAPKVLLPSVSTKLIPEFPVKTLVSSYLMLIPL